MKNSQIHLSPSSFHVTTPTLTSIPPKPSEVQREKDYHNWLRENEKREILVCCNSTANIIKGALEIGINQNELNVLKSVLHLHPYDRFGGNKFRVDKQIEVDVDSLIEEIVEISTHFSDEIQTYFLENFYDLVQKENPQSSWAVTLAKFNKKWKEVVLKPLKMPHSTSGRLNETMKEILILVEKNGFLSINKDMPDNYLRSLRRFVTYGLLEKNGGRYVMTRSGYDTLDNIEGRKPMSQILDFANGRGVSEQHKEGLKEMIKRNDIDRMLAVLSQQVDKSSEEYKEVLILQRRFSAYKDDLRKGVITRKEGNVEVNEIVLAVIELLDKS
jgi:hypothetical protein